MIVFDVTLSVFKKLMEFTTEVHGNYYVPSLSKKDTQNSLKIS